MGEVLMQPMGGGVGSDDVTAAKAQVLTGYNTVTTDSDDEVVAGTMPNNGAMNVTLTPSGNGSTNKGVAAGYYSGGTITANGSSSYSSGYSQGVSDADGRVNTSSASYNSGYANGHQTIKISGELWGTNDGSDYLATHVRNSSVSITIEKNSNIVATCSPIELRAGQIGMYVNGTHYTKGWNTGGTNSYNGTVPANSTVSFYTSAGGADTQRAGASFSLTVN